MIDIHHHCLPGVDDGPRELSEAAEMCAAAAEEGIETIVATPHVPVSYTHLTLPTNREV